MHLLESAPVHPALKPFVRAYAQRTFTAGEAPLVQSVPASLEHILEFDFYERPKIHYADGTSEVAYRIAVIGSHTRPGINMCLAGQIETFAIFLQPLGIWQLFRIPARELADRAYHGDDLLGRAVDGLWHELAECTNFQRRVAVTERYLLGREARASGCTAIMRSAIGIFERQGVCRIEQLAQQSGLSLRHYERRFTEEIAIRPKLFARITRYQMALDAKLRRPHRSWLSIAHVLGYHDQTHMIRDFRSLSGATPERLLTEIGDLRPPALAASLGEVDCAGTGELDELIGLTRGISKD